MSTREIKPGDTVEVRYGRPFDGELWVIAEVVSVESDRIGVLMMAGPDTGRYLALQTHMQNRVWR
jgi:hypothetical protein